MIDFARNYSLDRAWVRCKMVFALRSLPDGMVGDKSARIAAYPTCPIAWPVPYCVAELDAEAMAIDAIWREQIRRPRLAA